ncbi:MAG: putative transcriptional regulatory protein [Mycoplasmataceae bacterium]|nr:MAG: putative transcriptional regulatory protein [Mycoplasmataceae bacterium]
MAGHSHSANIKHRKDRQDNVRSQLFLKLRKKIENILREEREINEKSLSIARESKFPKDKIYQIWEKIKNEGKEDNSSRAFYQASHGIFIYLEDNRNITSEIIKKLNLIQLPLSSLSNYFQLLQILKVKLKEKSSNLEEYLLNNFPDTVWEKVNYDEKSSELISSDKEEIAEIKNFIEENKLDLIIEEERSFWKAIIPCQLLDKEQKDYYHNLEKEMIGSNFYTNV